MTRRYFTSALAAFAAASTIAVIGSVTIANGQQVKPTPINLGKTVPKPLFQLGDTPSKPHPDKGKNAQEFVTFFNKTFGLDLIPMGKEEVVWFPPQRAGDTSLELVAREVQPGTANCSHDINSSAPGSYPITCPTGEFSTAQFCRPAMTAPCLSKVAACHRWCTSPRS